jgi:hypothetical protein
MSDMYTFALFLSLMFSAATASAESEQPTVEQPRFYDHYMALQQMQRSFFQRSPEDQARLQPQMHGAERRACQRLSQERQQQVSKEDYRRQGGEQFVAFVEQFEQYCQTLQ